MILNFGMLAWFPAQKGNTLFDYDPNLSVIFYALDQIHHGFRYLLAPGGTVTQVHHHHYVLRSKRKADIARKFMVYVGSPSKGRGIRHLEPYPLLQGSRAGPEQRSERHDG